MYDVNGFVNGAVNIASFDDEEFAIAVTRSLYTLKAAAEIEPRPEARFVDIDMIIEELEKMEDEEDEEEEEVLITEEIEKKIEEIAYCNVANKFIYIFIGFVIGVFLMGVFQ
jgi:Fe-S-cluster formation regulator IscX/YfhJ